MAFESLSEKIQGAFKKLTNRGKLTETDVKEAMRDVRMALLEADVSYALVKDFVKKVTEKAVGAEVLSSLTPAQQVIKIVNEELTALMGGTNAKLTHSSSVPTIYMMCGLQGAGKTTMCAKLGKMLAKQGTKKPLLVACDVYRPAAVRQLQIVGQQAGVQVFEQGQGNPVEIAQNAIQHARYYGFDPVIIDTAGRLAIDEKLMQELRDIKSAVNPTEILLVVDAMTGQDAVNVADKFNKDLDVDGVILTKLDGDTRGGAAISVKAITGKPIKFSGIGEKLSDIEPFYPDRMAGRILGMGDVLSLIEKAQDVIDEKAAEELEKSIRTQTFSLDDYLAQLRQIKKMGSVTDILKMVPGIGAKLANVEIDEAKVAKEQAKTEAIILSMTKAERRHPDILNASRRRRIAAGSGTTVQQVNLLIKQYDQMKEMMKQMTGAKGRGKMRALMKQFGQG